MEKKKRLLEEELEKNKRLPEELIAEILVRLPVKAILRFKCVGKSWYYLIKSRYFINMHLKHGEDKGNERILVFRGHPTAGAGNGVWLDSYESPSYFSSYWKAPNVVHDNARVSGPCNGVVCIAQLFPIMVALCNPATREFRALPRPEISDPLTRFIVKATGLHLDSDTNDYKVVMFVGLTPYYPTMLGEMAPPRFGCQVYSMNTNSWRKIEHSIEEESMDIGPWPGDGILINGACHWIFRTRGRGRICCFNMSSEVLGYMELPPPGCIDGSCQSRLHLLILYECLALFANENEVVEIWIMQQYGVKESWTKKFTVESTITRLIRKDFTELLEIFEQCGVSESWTKQFGLERDLLLPEVEGRLERRLVSCATEFYGMNVSRILCRGFPITHTIMVYQETLVSLQGESKLLSRSDGQ